MKVQTCVKPSNCNNNLTSSFQPGAISTVVIFLKKRTPYNDLNIQSGPLKMKHISAEANFRETLGHTNHIFEGNIISDAILPKFFCTLWVLTVILYVAIWKGNIWEVILHFEGGIVNGEAFCLGKLADTPLCRGCVKEEETAGHVLCYCSSFSQFRIFHFVTSFRKKELCVSVFLSFDSAEQ